MSNYKDLQIKQNWGIKKDLTRISWSKILSRRMTIWTPPIDGWIKLNFNIFSKGNLSIVVGGGLIREHRGIFIEE